jgi:adenylate kinase family enzyme
MDALRRTLILGNSGSGKSTLAQGLAHLTDARPIDLDIIHWEADGHGAKRDAETARRMVAAAAADERWIIEGVYGWLADVALPRATALIWLDMPWPICRDGLASRGSRRGATDADGQALLAWAETYWQRTTSSSFVGHEAIFASFAGIKHHLRSRAEVSAFLATLPAGPE